ncbi:unnamed protein product [Parnassius apollo]|uniref:(apollo) hypothetical protein n=1 Tax=Parnassius apollo TaxID=110799 RepID=A0A8S3X307_PARAO|nr:unnamed protein product [Parnassius apollo]
MERLLEREAREVAALAGEARHARDSLSRTRTQRAALLSLRQHLARHLETLRHTEIRELENLVRVSDRKLYRSWEALKDSSDPAAFEPLLDEVKNKQTALEGLVRLINNRRSNISRAAIVPRPLPAPPRDDDESSTTAGSVRRRQEIGRRAAYKRRKRDATREPRSEPISGESSRHTPTVLVTVGQPTLELVTRASVRDLLFFTSN